MLIDVVGIGFHGKGAMLMLESIIQEVNNGIQSAEFATLAYKDYQLRARKGLYQRCLFEYRGFPINFFTTIIPHKIRSFYGIKVANDIDVILDASGFTYTDKWPLSVIKTTNKYYSYLRKRGKKIVLLPQAFGPFNDHRYKNEMKKLIQYADLVYARDIVSYNYIKAFVDNSQKLKISPDFTGKVKLTSEYKFGEKYRGNVAIVPNIRMLDKTDSNVSQNYYNSQKYIISNLVSQGYAPYFMIFDGDGDISIAKKINTDLNLNLDIVEENDALVAKAILGNSYAVISARFHALCSSLSQEVPSLSIGWSHKYQELLKEYNVSECIVDVTNYSTEYIRGKMEIILDEQKRSNIIATLKESNKLIQCKNLKMWKEVINLISGGDEKNEK